MRIARIKTDEGVFLARLGNDGSSFALVERDNLSFGSDPLRDMLSEARDPATVPSISAPASASGWSGFTVLAPLRNPPKLLGIGLNYADHAREAGLETPPAPIVFAKTTNSIVGPGEAIRWRAADSEQVDYEAELAVVIGREARDVSVDDAFDYVYGYTCCNDVSARDAQFADGQWVRGKSFDTFCPLGPWIVTADEIPDPHDLGIRCRVDGRTLQDSSTAEMIFGVADIVSYLSRVMTLQPGDVIATGTPFGVGFARKPPIFLQDGNVVEVDIDGIGTLSNPVVVE